MKKRYLIIFGVLIVTILFIYLKTEHIKKSKIKNILSGNWYSCENENCFSLIYYEDTNDFILGYALSIDTFNGNIINIRKLKNNIYELTIKHEKIDCNLKTEKDILECKLMCKEILCDEEIRKYHVDISNLSDKKIYIKELRRGSVFSNFTKFTYGYNLDMPYDEDMNVLDIFKNDENYLYK